MNESFKNSLKGFKVKGILIILGALVVIVLSANAFNSGKGFYIFCGIVALLTYAALVVVTILKSKQENEMLQQALQSTEKANAEKAAAKKAFEKQIAQLEKERNDAEFQLAQEKAKAKAAADTAAQAVKNLQKTDTKAEAKQTKKNNKK